MEVYIHSILLKIVGINDFDNTSSLYNSEVALKVCSGLFFIDEYTG